MQMGAMIGDKRIFNSFLLEENTIKYNTLQIHQEVIAHNQRQHAKIDLIMNALTGETGKNFLIPDLARMVVAYVGIITPVGERLVDQIVPIFDLQTVRIQRRRHVLLKLKKAFKEFRFNRHGHEEVGTHVYKASETIELLAE